MDKKCLKLKMNIICELKLKCIISYLFNANKENNQNILCEMHEINKAKKVKKRKQKKEYMWD